MSAYKNIILRADAGKSIGFGHFIRTLALAGYMNDDYECVFCSFNPELHCFSDYQLSEISKVCGYRQINAKSLVDYDAAFIDSLSGNEIVVLDNYYFSTEYQLRIKEKGCRLICIDDMHDRHMVADVVFTFCPLRRDDFSLEPYTQFYGGIEWSFLRSPFLATDISRNIRDKVHSVVLAIGGADPYGLTDKLIDVIVSVDKNLELSVIAGDTVSISSKYSDKINLYRKLTAEEIVKLFVSSDLGVFPASTICIEAFSQRLPVAAGWYVDNQKELYKEGVRKGWFFPLGSFLDSSEHLFQRFEKAIHSSDVSLAIDIDFAAQRNRIRNIIKSL